MPPSSKQQVTEILRSWNNEDSAEQQKQLTPILYDALKRLSRRYIRQEGVGFTLQTTDLLHEAYSQLVDADIDWENRSHFYAIAAKTMRRFLVDRAREKRALKRGPEFERVTFEESSISGDPEGDKLLDLDEALQALTEMDSRKAEIVELHYYGGLTYAELAVTLQISEATVDRELRFSRAWLASQMDKDSP